ncbi:MAG TPA: hypothetical protein VM866_03705 [Pyrinomonadaceae bacterium]|nr:hypothetical protein [Pyrinomonadaceae bacterium]
MNNSDRSAAAEAFRSLAEVTGAAFDYAGRGCFGNDSSARRASAPSTKSISQSECNGFALHPARDKRARASPHNGLQATRFSHTRQSFHRSGLGRAPRRVAGGALRSISRRQFSNNV